MLGSAEGEKLHAMRRFSRKANSVWMHLELDFFNRLHGATIGNEHAILVG
jgi:hypothetical protein